MTKERFFDQICVATRTMNCVFGLETEFSGELMYFDGKSKYVNLESQYEEFVKRGLPDNEAIPFLMENIAGIPNESSYSYNQFKEQLKEVFEKNHLEIQFDSEHNASITSEHANGQCLGSFDVEKAYDEFRRRAAVVRESRHFDFENFIKDKMTTIDYEQILKTETEIFRGESDIEPDKAISLMNSDIMAAETEATMIKHVAETVEKENISIPQGFSCPFSINAEALISELQSCKNSVSSLSSQNIELKEQIAELTKRIAELSKQTKEAGDLVVAIGDSGKNSFFASAGNMIKNFRSLVKETKDSITRPFKSMKDLFSKEHGNSDDEKLLQGIVTDADASDKVRFEQDKLISFDFLKNACDGIKKVLLNPIKDSAESVYKTINDGIQNSRYHHARHDVQCVEKSIKSKTDTLSTIQRCDEAIFTAKSGFMKAFHIAKGSTFVENKYEPSKFCSKIDAHYQKELRELNATKEYCVEKMEKLMPDSVRKAKEKAQADLNFLSNVEPVIRD